VREQCKEIAQSVRDKVKNEKKNQLRKIEEIKRQELNQWKRRKQYDTHQECGAGLSGLGAAHIAACETSCEDDESSCFRRKEFELLAAERGRSAMLQEQRKRDRAAEDRLAKRKQKHLKNAGVQTTFERHRNKVIEIIEEEEVSDEYISEEEAARAETFTNKRNFHKNSGPNYNPKNYTSNSIDSSNNFDSEGTNESLSPGDESEVEFNQISNLLKQKCFDFGNIQSLKIDHAESPEEEDQNRKQPQRQSQPANLKSTASTKKRVTIQQSKAIKKPQISPKKQQKVKYIDYANKYTRDYSPDDDLVTETHSGPNAMINATNEELDCLKGFKDETLR
jgi:hypothetical protein